MRSHKLVFLLSVLFFVSCGAGGGYLKLKIETPGKPSLNLDKYTEVAITGFLLKKEAEDFDLNQELMKYFAEELQQKIKKDISKKDISVKNDEGFEDGEFWRSVSEDSSEVLFFTGTAEYTSETRKAILKEQKRQEEDPFPDSPRLAERKFFTLVITLYLIDAETGTAVYKSDFQETRSYSNPNQTAYFAFFDLVNRIKTKFFRDIQGKTQIQERYLIQR
jgi:hypothetical protein